VAMWIRTLAAVALIALTSGCATSRSVVSLDQPSSSSTNPERGVAIKIIKVTDARVFEAAPKNPDTPSLSSDDMPNSSIKVRAIGRKRSGFGMALGDVLLPEGQTVSDMMASALADGFRQANYRVLTQGEAGYDTAIPIKAQVIQFWSWFQPGFWEVQVHNRSEVEITGTLHELSKGLTVQGAADESMMAVTESDWQEISSLGLKNFSENLVKALASKSQNNE